MNNYHIHEIIGRGRASKVYKARLKQSLEYVAVKACAKDAKPRVLQEVKVLNSMAHPHLLRFHTWHVRCLYETQNHLWVILEYCVGGDLLALLRSDGHLPEASVLRLGRDLAAALMALHSRGLLHCDIKPSNCLLDENGHLRLGGLGLSRRIEVVQRQLATLPNGLREMQQGSPFYLAPETVRTPGLYSTATDLWALGCVLYECAAGRPPFAATTTQALHALILEARPVPLPAVLSPELVGLVGRLLHPNPVRRCTWAELCSHPFWGASPPQLLALPEEPVMQRLVDAAERAAGGAAAGAAGGEQGSSGGAGLAAHHRASGSGSSLGGDAEFAGAGVVPGSAALLGADSAHSGASSSGGGDYVRGSTAAAPGGGQQQPQQQRQQHPESPMLARGGPSGEYTPATARAAAGGTAAAAPATPGPSADDPSATPAHPRAVSRTADMAAAAAGLPPETLTAVAADGAAGLAPQFAAQPASSSPPPGLRGGSGGGGGHLPVLLPLEALVYHPTDSVMKPIVGNKRIERPLEGLFNPSLLPFQPLPAAKVLAMPAQGQAAFVGVLARTISGAAHPHTKLATLVYCESLCSDPGLVGEMVNGDMGPALVRLLEGEGRDPALRLRAANLLGLLVRHASSISPALISAGACDALAGAARQREDPGLQRRAAAALGELLFYADSQQRESAGQGGGQAAPWGLSADAVHRLAALLEPGQDEVAQHYAAKALENVFGLGGPWAQRLASPQVMMHLVQLVESRAPDVLRGTAASALCRLLRCAPTCLGSLVGSGGVDLIATGLTDASPRVQQACVTILCQALCHRPLASAVTELCLGSEAVLEGLATLLDNTAELLQAKALLALALLCRTPTGLSCVVSWPCLLPQLERMCARERLSSGSGSGGGSEHYMAATVAGLHQQLALNVVPLLHQASAAARAARAAGAGSGSSASSSTGALQPLEALLLLLSSAAFRTSVVCEGLVTGLADLLTREVSAAPAPGGSADVELKAHVITAIDAVCSHPELLIEQYASVLSHLLPALSASVASQRESPDTRFCCLKLLCDVVLQFVNEPRLYLSATPSEHTTADSGIANRQIDSAVGQYVLPLMPPLFADEDPMPLYALKLLGALLEFNRRWVADVAAAGLASSFFEWLSIAHPHNNVHNMRLCRLVADARVLPPQELERLQAVDRVLAVLGYAAENDVESFLEPALHLTSALLADVGPSETLKVIAVLPLLLELASSAQHDTALAAAHCLLKAAHLHPGDAAAVLAEPESVACLVSLLDPAASGSTAAAAAASAFAEEPQQMAAPAFNADTAPLLLLVLAQLAAARPELLREYGASLRPAVAACLDAVGDPGLRRRWAPLLAQADAAA